MVGAGVVGPGVVGAGVVGAGVVGAGVVGAGVVGAGVVGAGVVGAGVGDSVGEGVSASETWSGSPPAPYHTPRRRLHQHQPPLL